MRKIFKYKLNVAYDGIVGTWDPVQVIEMPGSPKILSVGIQAGEAMLWALVNPDAEKQRKKVYVTNTGGELGDEFVGRRFLGTLIFGSGGIVLHVWE